MSLFNTNNKMATKVYTSGNYFYLEIEGTTEPLMDSKCDVRVWESNSTTNNFIIHSPNLGSHNIPLTDLVDADDIAFDSATWKSFYENNTGGFDYASLNGATGYGVYFDDQYTSVATALSTTAGNTSIIDINGSTVLRGQMPIGVTEMYDVATSKIIPIKENDGFAYTLSFYAQNTITEGAFEIFLDLGGGFTEVFGRVTTFPRGSNTTQPFTFTTFGYQGATFKANGGLIKLKSERGTTKIFNASLQIHKTHDAR